MTRRGQILVGVMGLGLFATFGAGMLVARATPAGATRNRLSFAGNVQPVPAAGATIGFTFSNADTGSSCTVSAGSPAIDGSGNFVAELDLGGCPAGFAFDGGDVTYVISLNGAVVGGAQPVNPVPYAKYADRAGYDPRLRLTTATYTGSLSATNAAGIAVTGFEASRVICQATLGSRSGHLCSNDEVYRYVGSGAAASMPASTAFRVWSGFPNSSTFPRNDCGSFTSTSGGGASISITWKFESTPNYSNFKQLIPVNTLDCSTPLPLACCE